MALQPLTGFRHFTTHHCVTGSMRHIYAYNRYDLSEELLLGLGSGVSFIYWHTQGQAPFLGGRGQPKPSMEQIAGQRSGVAVQTYTSSSSRRAQEKLVEILNAGQPAMLQVDMGYLPYFDFHGEEYHFGGHAVVVCGYDPESEALLVADRDELLHPVPMTDMFKARNSSYKPFPPHNRWYSFDFSQKRLPTQKEIWQAIGEQTQSMLRAPISNLGVRGIRKAANKLPEWPSVMKEDELRSALFNAYILISAIGGSGGGLFRYMFGRFLNEAAQKTGDRRLEDYAGEFQIIGDCWEGLADLFRTALDTPNPSRLTREAKPRLEKIADMEEAAWRRLNQITDRPLAG
jgi:hypothetical protein